MSFKALVEVYNIELKKEDSTFLTKDSTQNNQIIDILKEELHAKDRQIEQLQKLLA